MGLFKQVVKDIGFKLVDNLHIISNNLKLTRVDSAVQLGFLYEAYAKDIFESLGSKDTLGSGILESLSLLKKTITGNGNLDNSDHLSTSFVIKKLLQESLEHCHGISIAMQRLDKERETLREVGKLWEFNSPLDEMVDMSRVTEITENLAGVDLGEELGPFYKKWNNYSLDLACAKIDKHSNINGIEKSLNETAEEMKSLFREMENLNYNIYEEFTNSTELDGNHSPHHSLNGIIGKVRLSDLKKIKEMSLAITVESRKLLKNYLDLHEQVRSDLLDSDSVSAFSRIDTVTRERMNSANFALQSLDKLNIMTDRSIIAIESNLNRLLNVKGSRLDLFKEMLPFIGLEEMKKAS